MRQDNTILQELKEIAPGLADIPKPGNGTVPEGYFRDLQEAVWAGIQSDTSDEPNNELQRIAPVLAGIKVLSSEPEVIDFTALQQSIIDKLQSRPEASVAEELSAIAPTLATIPKNATSDTIPDGYFQELQSKVFTSSSTSKSATRFSLSFNKRSWYTLSAAASVLLLLVTGWWWMQQAPVTNTSSDTHESLALTDEEILMYLTLDQEGLDAGMLLALDNSIVTDPVQSTPEKGVSKKYNNKNSNSTSKSGTPVEEEELDQLLDELDADDLENLF